MFASRALQLIFVTLCIVTIYSYHGLFVKSSITIRRNIVNVRSSTSEQTSWSPRIQKIKNLTLYKDILRDITAGEFALRLEATHSKKDQIVDFDRLISKLDADLLQLERRRTLFADSDTLISRILRVREDLLLAAQNLPLKNTDFILTDPFEPVPDALVETQPSSDVSDVKMKELRDNLRIRVREDGTVDWDGTLASGKEIAKFGAELWERLNGKQEGVPTFSEVFGTAPEKSIVNPEIERMDKLLRDTQEDVVQCVREREDAKAALRKSLREGGASSASKESVQAIKRMDLQVKELSKRAKLLALNLDLEKICAYLQKELEASAEPVELRGLVAEVSLIDRQLCGVMAGLDLASMPSTNSVDHEADLALEKARAAQLEALLLIDDEEVNLISTVVQDLKSRLGIDTQQLLPTMDWGSLGIFVRENINRVKAGLSFFKEGTSLLVSDVQYAWLLFRKAIRGYTLKPREVNVVRRAGRDLLTLIPFTIILIIPMTPIGHVLVFTFIQRYFPNFFPSCYTEKRLNLKRLFSEVERRSEEQEVGSLLDSATLGTPQRGFFRDLSFSTGALRSAGGPGVASEADRTSNGTKAVRTGLNATAVVEAMRWASLRKALDRLVDTTTTSDPAADQSKGSPTSNLGDEKPPEIV